MLLDTLPFASGSPKSMMSGQVPALERLRQDDANLRQAWTTQSDMPSKKKMVPKLYALYLLAQYKR